METLISLNIGCWNVQYFKTAQLYFRSIIDDFDILAISEHSIFAEQLKMPKNVTNGSIEIHGVSAHDNSLRSNSSRGCGFSRCGFSLKKQIE